MDFATKTIKGITTVTPARLFYDTEILSIQSAFLHYCWRERKIWHSQLRENEFGKQLTSWESRAVKKRRLASKTKSWGIIMWLLSGFQAYVNEMLFHSWCSVITLDWKLCSRPESHDEYLLNHFFMATNVKAFPKFRMTTNSLRFLDSLALGDVVGWHSSHWDFYWSRVPKKEAGNYRKLREGESRWG